MIHCSLVTGHYAPLLEEGHLLRALRLEPLAEHAPRLRGSGRLLPLSWRAVPRAGLGALHTARLELVDELVDQVPDPLVRERLTSQEEGPLSRGRDAAPKTAGRL